MQPRGHKGMGQMFTIVLVGLWNIMQVGHVLNNVQFKRILDFKP